MHRRLSSLVKAPKPSASDSNAGTSAIGDDDSKESTVLDAPPPPLKVKRVDYYYSRWSGSWKYRNMSSKVTVERRPITMSSGESDPWKDYTFVIVRKVPRNEDEEPTFKIVIKSDYLLNACRNVIQALPGLSWNSTSQELKPEIFITFLPDFTTYRDELASKKSHTSEDQNTLSCVSLLIDTIQADFRTTLAQLMALTSHGEITYDLLYAILVPRTTFIARCAITGEVRLLYLVSVKESGFYYELSCESVDIIDPAPPLTGSKGPVNNASGSSSNGSASSGTIGKVHTTIRLYVFEGTIPITTLDCYPLGYHPDPERVKAEVLQRGKKWLSLSTGGPQHVQYHGIAALKCDDKVLRHSVDGRIMVDRATFRRLNVNYQFPMPVPSKEDNKRNMSYDQRSVYSDYDGRYNQRSAAPPTTENNGIQTTRREEADMELTDEELLLTPAVVYGFSLSDKIWLEFNVTQISNIQWSEDAFANLVLPQDRKLLLQSLVEAHHRGLEFDDFIKGKGRGLVINLFGPPGVGKTFSAEATSEYVKRPLYVIGGGDLGTTAAHLDASLERVFDVATAWKAIILIDEADVFLEQRSLHDLERNAMVAVFLRHVEYYRGILFLTTNRVKAFDDAFLSRIHVALHFRELSDESKKQVWAAFINKAGSNGNITEEEIELLSKRNVNGRQIKNAVRTAYSLALACGEKVAFKHLIKTLDAMDEFTEEFRSMRVNGSQ